MQDPDITAQHAPAEATEDAAQRALAEATEDAARPFPEDPVEANDQALQNALESIPELHHETSEETPETSFVTSTVDDQDDDTSEVQAGESFAKPSRRSSTGTIEDMSEEVPHRRSWGISSDFQMLLGLWAEVSGISRKDWQGLLQVLRCCDDLDHIKELPECLTTLKRRMRADLPLMKMRRKEIPLLPQKLKTRTTPAAQLYWFDPMCFFQTILSAPGFLKQLHHGVAHFVDNPSELYHSYSWASSIRASLGQHPSYSDGSPIFQSDVVYFHCRAVDCRCQGKFETDEVHLGRVFAVGQDYRHNGHGAVILRMQLLLRPALSSEIFPQRVVATFASLETLPQEAIFLEGEDALVDVGEEDVLHREVDVSMDYSFGRAGNAGLRSRRNDDTHCKVLIRRSLAVKDKTFWPLYQTPTLPAQQELLHFGREHLVNAARHDCISVPYLCFIDGFGFFRNTYRTLMGWYMTPAGLNARERFRRANVYPLTLGPHGSNTEDVVTALAPGLAKLDEGVPMEINGSKKIICAFVLAFTGDMPQQNENCGMMGPTANFSCRYCMVDAPNRGDLKFDVRKHARIHREHIHSLRKMNKMAPTLREAECRKHGYENRTTPPPLLRIAPAVNIPQSFPSDPAHSELKGISGPAHDFLLKEILTDAGAIAFNETLQRFPVPTGWPRLQSMIRYRGSYSIQEHGYASILVPFVLRCWLTEAVMQGDFVEALKKVYATTGDTRTPVDIVVASYAFIARSNTILMGQNLTRADLEHLPETIQQCREAYKKLFEAGAHAYSLGYGTHSRQATRSPSPANSDSSMSSRMSVFSTAPIQIPRGKGKGKAKTKEQQEKEKSDKLKRAAALDASYQRPNSHLGPHYIDLFFWYANSHNICSLMGEDKHGFFKKFSSLFNGRDPEPMLLGHENLNQTIRFILAGSHEATEPELTAQIRRLFQLCPVLFQSIIAPTEFAANKLQGEEENMASASVMDDPEHDVPAVLGCIKPGYARAVMGLPTRPDLQPNTHPFNLALCAAYENDYKKRHVYALGKIPLQWCKKLTFTTR